MFYFDDDQLMYNGDNVTILRLQASGRGGGIEIDLSSFGYLGEKMAAYQNYLGGGLLGAIQVNDTLRQPGRPWLADFENVNLDEIGENLKRLFHTITNPEDEWAGSSYDENQSRPAAAY